MTSVEKRRSSRKSSKHRKRSNGGFSDTSSCGSFLDENDREVSSLTDRAFKSLCIGDEAVYNDSDLGFSSPSTHPDRQLAFINSQQYREVEEREDLKAAAHQNFSFRLQQYGQDWIHGGMYGTTTPKDPERGLYRRGIQGRVSATFQHSFVETSQQGVSLREEELSYISNGATELSSQQHRSRSRVSSLIKAFNSDVHEDGGTAIDKFGVYDETSWDKSARTIQKELCEFSSSCQQNFNREHFLSVDPFSQRNTNMYGPDMSTMAHMSYNSFSPFIRSSHGEHSMSLHANCNSHFFVHSEFSPFRVWRDHNRFPFQQGAVSGFMHGSEFPRWYETQMYKELSFENQLQAPYRGMRYNTNNLAPVPLSNDLRFMSSSSMQQKACAVEKRSESELAGHYPQRRRSRSVGANKLPSQRPSTASPTVEMSRRVRDTISSVKALQEKIKLMSQQNISAGMATTQQEVYRSNSSIYPDGNAVIVDPNALRNNITTAPFNISKLLTPSIPAHQEGVISDLQQYAASTPPMEHSPVRAESRGATPDIRMSTYKSRATSLLFNLKDNRKRVKSTYSPTKFKGFDKQDTHKQTPIQEPSETVIDMPDWQDSVLQAVDLENVGGKNLATDQKHSPSMPLETQLEIASTGQYLGNTLTNYQTAPKQGQMVHHSGFSDFVPENYASNQLTNGQNRHDYLASFTPYDQGGIDNVQQPHAAVEAATLNVTSSQSQNSLWRKAESVYNSQQTASRICTEEENYKKYKDKTHHHHKPPFNESQENCEISEKLGLNAASSTREHDNALVIEKSRQAHQDHLNNHIEIPEFTDSFVTPLYNNVTASNSLNHVGTEKDQHETRESIKVQNMNSDTNQERSSELKPNSKDISSTMSNALQKITTSPRFKEDETKSLQPIRSKNGGEEKSSESEIAPELLITDSQLLENRGEQIKEEITKQDHAEVATTQQKVQAEKPTTESARLISDVQTGHMAETTDDSKTEETKLVTQKQDIVTEEEMKQEQRKYPRRKQTEVLREELMADETGVWKTEEAPVIPKKDEHIGEEIKQAEVKQAETEKPQEEHKKTEAAKESEPERIKHPLTIDNAAHEEIRQLSHEQNGNQWMVVGRNETEQREVEMMEAKCKASEKPVRREDDTNQENHTRTEEARDREVKAKNTTVERHLNSKLENFASTCQINAEKTASHVVTVKDAGAEESNMKQVKRESKVDQTKAELLKSENLLERSDKLKAKLAATQQVRSEPDKVEQVKTELAKAKAELAKIKEKMRDEQKNKAANSLGSKEDGTLKNNVILKVETAKTEGRVGDPMEVYRGVNDYNQLREKYGFKHLNSFAKNMSTSEGASNHAGETIHNVVDVINNEPCKKEKTLVGTLLKDATQHDKIPDVEVDRVRSQSVSSTLPHPTKDDGEVNEHGIAQKFNDALIEKQVNFDLIKSNNTPKEDCALAKLQAAKPEPSEQSKGLSKDSNPPIPKTLTNKEKVQTKQEILTSKIKAHAEKEISAIKGKGFSFSKNSSKPLPNSQSVTIRQKPVSQLSKSHDTSVKNQPETAGVQAEKDKTGNYLSSAMPATSDDPATQIVVLTEKSRRQSTITGADLNIANHSVDKQFEVTSLVQNIQDSHNSDANRLDVNPSKSIDKPKEEFPDSELTNSNNPDNIRDKPAHSADHEPKASTLTATDVQTEEAPTNETIQKDSECPTITFGHTDVDVSLQIVGIMVTVRERKLSQTSDEGLDTKDTEETGSKNESNKSELVERGLRQGLEEKPCMKPIEVAQADSTVVENQVEVVKNILSENVNAPLSSESLQVNAEQIIKEWVANPQQESHTNSQEKTIPKLLNGNDVPPTKIPPKEFGKDLTVPSTKNSTKREEAVENVKTEAKTLAECIQHMETDEEKSRNLTPTTDSSQSSLSNEITCKAERKNKEELSSGHVPVEKDQSHTANGTQSYKVNEQNLPVRDENRQLSANLYGDDTLSNNGSENKNKRNPLGLQNNEKSIEDDNLHIGCIAIRVVSPAMNKEKTSTEMDPHIPVSPTTLESADEKQVASPSCTESSNTRNNGQSSTNKTPAISDQTIRESLEDRLRVQHVLSSVKKLSDSLKMNNKQSSLNPDCEKTEIQNDGASTDTGPKEVDYFQVQSPSEKSNSSNDICSPAELTSNQKVSPTQTASSITLCTDMKPDAFVFNSDDFTKEAVESKSENLPGDIKKTATDTTNPQDSKLNFCSNEQCRGTDKIETGEGNRVSTHHPNTKCHLSALRKENSINSSPTREERLKAAPEVKPKPKQKASTIPEISAIADYARLKVIVPENREVNTMQEFPPNKKEGFFPLIRTQNSRRPTFASHPPVISGKDNSPPSKTEASAKVGQDSKPVVLPIMGREHQRTGMFKLGEKEKQEKMLLDSNKLTAAQTKQTAGAEKQRPNQRPGRSNNQFPHISPSSAPNQSIPKGPTSLSSNENINPKKEEMINNHVEKDKETVTLHKTKDDFITQQDTNHAKQLDGGHPRHAKMLIINKEENRNSDVRIKHMVEESRATLAEEDRKAAQREEEKRARERRAVALMIKERREKLRQTELKAEEEGGMAKQRDKITVQHKEDVPAQQMREERESGKTMERQGVMSKVKVDQEKEQGSKSSSIEGFKEQDQEITQDKEWRRADQNTIPKAEEQRMGLAAEHQNGPPLERQRRWMSEKQQRSNVEEKQQEERAVCSANEIVKESLQAHVINKVSSPEEANSSRYRSGRPLENPEIVKDLKEKEMVSKNGNSSADHMKKEATQKQEAQKMEGPQYYAFTSAKAEGNSRDRQPPQESQSEQGSSPMRRPDPSNDSFLETKANRPLPPSSPASSLPRSNTSSPALGIKPSMFKVKDNTLRGSSYIKSVKPRFHKNFGEDFSITANLDRGADRGGNEQEPMRYGAGTPVHAEIEFKRFPVNSESPALHDYPTAASYPRPYSRRSIAMDDDESRSVISNLSEDVESYATSAADLADVRGLSDYERPESACSFSSDASRSLSKPPVVPPKTEKALRRAQRLTSRRIKKELSKVSAGNPVGGDKEVPSAASSSSAEVGISHGHAVASPHCSQPISIAHAPVLGSRLPSSNADHQSTPSSFHAATHASGPLSHPALPNSSSGTAAPTASAQSPHPAAPKALPHARTSSALHHANHGTPVTQYQVESACFPQSFPLTQRKVLQDLGSGQLYVVDVPVPVKTKTFFDPETGKYVQLNVRESGGNLLQPQTPQTHLRQMKLQQQSVPRTPTAGERCAIHQRNNSNPQGYQPSGVAPLHRSSMSAPGSLQPDQDTVHLQENTATNASHHFSPERTLYMDTVNDADKTLNSSKNTQHDDGFFSKCEMKNQTPGSSVHENVNKVPRQYQSCDIIPMGDLEDFMEVSDF